MYLKWLTHCTVVCNAKNWNSSHPSVGTGSTDCFTKCHCPPWTEEPGGLQSMGSQRVGHDWATSLSLFLSQSVTVLHGQRSLVCYSPWGLKELDTTEWLNWSDTCFTAEGRSYPLQYSGVENSMDCSLPGSSVRGICQARVLEWGAIAFSCV